MSEDKAARSTGGFFYHQQPGRLNPVAQDAALQDRLIDYCRGVSGVTLP